MYIEIIIAPSPVALQDKVNRWVITEAGRVRVLNISPMSYQGSGYFVTVVYEPRQMAYLSPVSSGIQYAICTRRARNKRNTPPTRYSD